MEILYKTHPKKAPANPIDSERYGFAHVATQKIYKKIETKSGHTWYIPVNTKYQVENIHVANNLNRNGYGGSTLHFMLEDGTKEPVKGPWHSNADSLFKDTGIDLRNTYLTWGIIGRNFGKDYANPTIEDVLYIDKQWCQGSFYRIEYLANKMAKQLNKNLVFFSQSCGGSVSGHAFTEKRNLKSLETA
jgi:hypothetical protein